MFSEDLKRLVRRGVAELDRDIEMLESLLAAARDAREIFQEAVSSAENDYESLPEDDHETPSLPPREELEIETLATVCSVTGGRDRPYSDFEEALMTSGKRGTHDLVGMARVWADMHDGMVLSRDLAVALRALDFSQSSMENLPSYLSRKMASSGDFVREGKRGTGLYRRVYSLGPAQDSHVLDWPADGEKAVSSSLPDGGTDAMV